MSTPMEREIRRFLGRVRGARFLGGFCEALLVLVLGSAALLVSLRLCEVVVTPSPWWALLILPALVWAWLGVRRLDFGRGAGAAHLDRRLGLDGLLVTSLERDASAYQGLLRRKLHEARAVLPRLRTRPLFARLGAALAVLVIVLLLPAPREPLGRSSVVADVLEDYREKLAELAEKGGIREEVREELAQRLEAMEQRLQKSGDVAWKDLDTYEQAAEQERALHAARLAKSQQELASFARGEDAFANDGPAAASQRMNQLLQDADAAGLLDQLPPALRERLSSAQVGDGSDGAQGAASTLGAETMKQLAAALAQSAGDKLGTLGAGSPIDAAEAMSLDELLAGTDVDALFGKPCTLCTGKDGKPGDPGCPG